MSEETLAERSFWQKLIAKKRLDVLIREATNENVLKRSLSAFDLICFGVGGIIGTGIFVLSGVVAAKNAGPSVIISFIVAGVASAFAGLCYAELSSMIPVSGSAYTYTAATMGEFASWIIGWDLILEYLVGASTVAVGFSSYFQSFLRDAFNAELPSSIQKSALHFNATSQEFVVLADNGIDLIAILFTMCCCMILIFGVKESARCNGAIVVLKCTVIVIVICSTIGFINTDNLHPLFPPNEGRFGAFGPTGMLQGATVIFFAYIGFDAVSACAQETKNPQRDLPIGILGSLLICTILYILMAICLVGLVPYKMYEGKADPITFAIQSLGPNWRWLAILVSLAAIAGLASVQLTLLMAQPRIFYSMANDGLFPKFASKVHPKYKTPWTTTILCSIACAALAGILPIDVLGELTSIGTLFAFLMVAVAVVILRIKQPELERKFKVPGGPYFVPAMAFITSGLLVCTASWQTLFRLAIWLAVGMLIYFLYGRNHSKINHPEKWPMEGYGKSEEIMLPSYDTRQPESIIPTHSSPKKNTV